MILRKRKPIGWRETILIATAGLVVLFTFAGYFAANPLLFVEGGARHADAIVVLGGDSANRVFRALDLYKAGSAPKILISGTGDCFHVRDLFLLAGVSSNALLIECRSRNTRENAEFSVRLMEESGMKRAIVVTSWWHSRRAVSCFRHFGKGLEISSYPTYDGPNMDHKPGPFESGQVFREYSGLLWYLVRYGITPCRNFSESSSSDKAAPSHSVYGN